MKCPICQAENLEDSMFCGKCGVEMFELCPICSDLHLVGTDFCTVLGGNIENYNLRLKRMVVLIQEFNDFFETDQILEIKTIRKQCQHYSFLIFTISLFTGVCLDYFLIWLTGKINFSSVDLSSFTSIMFGVGLFLVISVLISGNAYNKRKDLLRKQYIYQKIDETA
jgi:hypothetical protein